MIVISSYVVVCRLRQKFSDIPDSSSGLIVEDSFVQQIIQPGNAPSIIAQILLQLLQSRLQSFQLRQKPLLLFQLILGSGKSYLNTLLEITSVRLTMFYCCPAIRRVPGHCTSICCCRHPCLCFRVRICARRRSGRLASHNTDR